VYAKEALRGAASDTTSVEERFSSGISWPKALLRAIRPHQWSKNLLVFVPMVTAREIDALATWSAAAATFLAFSVAASGMYLINDLRDLAHDRRHPRKRQRPFASGALPLRVGLIAIPVLLLCGVSLAAVAGALTAILFYVAASAAYSLSLRAWPLIDVFLLASLYAARIVGGGLATGYHVTLWLLAFSSFLFLSLAIAKRVSELMNLSHGDVDPVAGRGYRRSDAAILQMIGVASSFASSIVLSLYVQSQKLMQPGTSLTLPSLSWILIPLILFWQCRIWLAAARGRMQDDPIVFAARDWVSWLVAVCSAAVMFLEHRITF
jgi:4-hydroxybenzoate polyprenyltransferase